jgi:hypothetical protein
MAQNAAANPEIAAAPAPESVKDMSQSTRQVLEKLSSMLKDARPLSPSDARPDRAEAPASGSAAKPSLASAANGDNAQPPGNNPAAPAEPQTALTAGRDDGGTTPR